MTTILQTFVSFKVGDLDTVDIVQSALPTTTMYGHVPGSIWSGNDLYNVDDMEVDQLQSGHMANRLSEPDRYG